MNEKIAGQPAKGGVTTSTPDAKGPGLNEMVLFWASFLTLIAAGMGFAVRGDILGDWGQEFGFTQTELGGITGGGLVGFRHHHHCVKLLR